MITTDPARAMAPSIATVPARMAAMTAAAEPFTFSPAYVNALTTQDMHSASAFGSRRQSNLGDLRLFLYNRRHEERTFTICGPSSSIRSRQAGTQLRVGAATIATDDTPSYFQQTLHRLPFLSIGANPSFYPIVLRQPSETWLTYT